MKHFGIAFGVIIATAIGGAVVFDRYESHKTLAIPQPAKVQANAAPEETSGTSAAPTRLAQAEPPAVGKVEPAPAPMVKTETTTKKAPVIAASTRPSRSTRSTSSATVDTQDSATVTIPTPPPADTSPAPASAPPSTTNDQAASPPPSASSDSAASATQQQPAAQ